MKKGQELRKIRQKKTVEDKIKAAKYGRFADKRAFAAYQDYEMMKLAAETFAEMDKRHGSTHGSHGPTLLLQGLSKITTALDTLDSEFFEELAELLKFFRRGDFLTSPEWTAFGVYMWRQEQAVRYGERAATDLVTYEEVEHHLHQKFVSGVGEGQITKMVAAFGVKLARGKPGPKPERRKRQ